jgi:hypothetical protein
MAYRSLIPNNAHVLAQKYVGVTFAPFAKGMTTYFCRSGTDCYEAMRCDHK